MPDSGYYDMVDSIKLHELRFHLMPDHLTKFHYKSFLYWEKVRFSKKNSHIVPEGRGVYAFAIEWNESGLPPHGYIMYIGKAGDGGHSLRKRFKDYFQDLQRPKRPAIHNLLTRWKSVLSFYYAQVVDEEVQLTEIEAALNDALLPPFSKKDFSAKVRTALNAFEN